MESSNQADHKVLKYTMIQAIFFGVKNTEWQQSCKLHILIKNYSNFHSSRNDETTHS